jgi:predicted DNA-binding transcriptional regulator AlpA
MLNDFEKLLSLNEVLKIFRISRPTLCKWEKDEILQPIKIGNIQRYREKDIKELIENRNKS